MSQVLSSQRQTWEVRNQAAAILAALGERKLGKIAVFRAAKWETISAKWIEDQPGYAAEAWFRSAEWCRIGMGFGR